MNWDDNSIKQLQKLWEKGLSATEIAKKMNVSKNAIVGKVHRLCLKARPSPIKKKEADLFDNDELVSATEQVEEIKDIELVQEPEIAVQPNADTEQVFSKPEAISEKKSKTKSKTKENSSRYIKLVELDSHTCRWPIGDPRDEDFCFCGKSVHAGQTYCDEHSQIAYVKALPKK